MVIARIANLLNKSILLKDEVPKEANLSWASFFIAGVNQKKYSYYR